MVLTELRLRQPRHTRAAVVEVGTTLLSLPTQSWYSSRAGFCVKGAWGRAVYASLLEGLEGRGDVGREDVVEHLVVEDQPLSRRLEGFGAGAQDR